jgi:hypothetical protein
MPKFTHKTVPIWQLDLELNFGIGLKNGLASPLMRTKTTIPQQKLRLILGGQMSFTFSEYNPPRIQTPFNL